MTARHYRAACAVTAAVIAATLGAILGHAVAPPWWTLTAAVVCGGVVAAFGLAWEQQRPKDDAPVFEVREYHVVGRAFVRRPEYGRLA